mmetsp:Transcript_18320/g.50858  ORF Transcript_18320/g.50858 Transcript_18320/m.50858 type:complete len:363 (-) Transcript_18320:938-2026(-)|eukprot:CAMPEP_0198127036 /NCGR_PEP_ID=MMETSP1442-20131203/46306_1 /TAXON_ID= /ORGANISM="Craspedostauros australis, Strain CCMP3328" /LENGTH=362 /DNA_ID=CAMNT_0043786947 /DNA_START=33 /DNA_END=1121 /DNA_ORIENTATION=+
MAGNFVDDERFDGLYLNVAQTTRGIEPLLDTVFSFLRRKTDFFAGPPGADDGTEAAIAKVQQVLQKHAERYQKEHPSKKPSIKKAAAKVAEKSKVSEKEAKKEAEDVIEMGAGGGFDISEQKQQQQPQKTQKQPPSATQSQPGKPEATTKKEPKDDKEDAPKGTKDDAPKEAKTTTSNDDENDDADSPVIIDNGIDVPGRYVWTQTLSELSVSIPVPDNTRGRDLNVTIARNHLKAALRSADKGEYLINAPLTKTIICDDSFWTIEDGNRLAINLQKLNQMEWWDSVCQDDPVKLNVQKIQPESSKLGELDGETRQTVEKMMYDQRQKAMGLPSSDEEAKLNALERFKKQHPEMDFSNAKMS